MHPLLVMLLLLIGWLFIGFIASLVFYKYKSYHNLDDESLIFLCIFSPIGIIWSLGFFFFIVLPQQLTRK